MVHGSRDYRYNRRRRAEAGFCGGKVGKESGSKEDQEKSCEEESHKKNFSCGVFFEEDSGQGNIEEEGCEQEDVRLAGRRIAPAFAESG
jgi:hypothetical protein